MHVRRFMGAYLITTALLGKFEAWNASWAARHPNIFWMFAVRHSKAIGLTLSQALLCTSAMHVVQPDMAWNDREQGWKMNADGFLVTVLINLRLWSILVYVETGPSIPLTKENVA